MNLRVTLDGRDIPDVDAQELSPEATDNEVLAMASRLTERDLSRSHTVSKEENRFLVRPSAVYG